MRDLWLKKLAGWHARHPWRMAAAALLVTLIMAGFSTQLTVTMRWSDLLPEKDPRTVQYNKIVDEFATATSIVVVAQGEEARIKAFADDLAPRLLTLRDSVRQTAIIKRVDYKREENFLRDHGLRLIKAEDLENMQEIFTDPNLPGLLTNLNNAMEKEYTQREESLSSREKEDGAVAFLDGVDAMVDLLTRTASGTQPEQAMVNEAMDRLLIGDPYFLSYDRSALILNAIPTFSVTDVDLMVRGTDAVQELLDELQLQHPEVKAGLTGMIPLGRDEMVYSEKSMGVTTMVAVVAILVLLMLAFRLWLAPVLAMVNLLLGIVWAIGLTAILVGQLNIMTQMMAVILLGLGIDFSVHMIAGFTEQRGHGRSIEESLDFMFVTNGKGIVTGGLTTAFAFLTLMISSSRGMKEMGLVTGAGLLAILAATFMILPIFLVLRERRVDRKHDRRGSSRAARDLSFRSMGHIGAWLGRHRVITLVSALVLTALMGWAASRITFDQNYLNMEPKGLVSVTLNDTILDKFDLSMDYALVLADSPAESRRMAKEARKMGSVAMVDDIGFYLPSEEEQAERALIIGDISRRIQKTAVTGNLGTAAWNTLLTEIDRLEMNVMEMQDLAYMGLQSKVEKRCAELVGSAEDESAVNRFEQLRTTLNQPEARQAMSRLNRQWAPRFKESVQRMARPAVLAMEDLPQSVIDRYANADGDRFLMTVYPSDCIWLNMAFMERFTNDMDQITPNVTGMPSIFHTLLQVIGRDGRYALMLTLVVVFVLLWLDFRNPRHALMAMIPLAAGTLWMVGLMKLTGMQFTVINVMGLPMIIGIGIDDGVHIVHRWLAEGRQNLRVVFASTGKAVLLTSLTTMLGFGSLVFSLYRGFASLGGALFLGVAACFLTTVLFLPVFMKNRD